MDLPTGNPQNAAADLRSGDVSDAARRSIVTPMGGDSAPQGRSGPPRFRTAWLVGAFLLGSCSRSSVDTGETVPRMQQTSMQASTGLPVVAELEVTDIGFRPVSFEHWEGGASVISAGYTWGAAIENSSDMTALDVSIEALFLRDGHIAMTTTYTVDAIPPGPFAWGGRPVIVPGADVDEVSVSVVPAEFADEVPTRDRLVSPRVVAAPVWQGEVLVEAIEDDRRLYVIVAFYGTDGRLIAVEPGPVDPTVLVPGSAVQVFVPAVPEGGGQFGEVRVFLARLDAEPVTGSETRGRAD